MTGDWGVKKGTRDRRKKGRGARNRGRGQEMVGTNTGDGQRQGDGLSFRTESKTETPRKWSTVKVERKTPPHYKDLRVLGRQGVTG